MKLSLLGLVTLALPSLSDFTNPIIWQDFADLDIIRVDNVFYYSASNMHYSPGAPILRSYDFINWEFVGHSVPEYTFGPDYYLDGGQAYIQGTWASSMQYRASTDKFYWIGCISGKTYIYTATNVEDTWSQATVIDTCYYDVGLLVSSNDTMYAAYGNSGINVAELSSDGLSQVSTQVVYSSDVGYLEGSRFYERNGNFYILTIHPSPPVSEHVLMSTTGPWGPYTRRTLISEAGNPVTNCGYPHQGGIIDTPDGDWYYMAFVDAYPGGRIPVLAPVTWDDDGWPSVELVDGAWNTNYETPNIAAANNPMSSFGAGTDDFSGTKLSVQWEWNHNPNNEKWSINDGLTLQTASITEDLYGANNTVTHRITGPESSGTIHLNVRSMATGDRAGLTLLRESSAWIGVVNDDGTTHIGVTTGLEMDDDWKTVSTGQEVATAAFSADEIWLRADANIAPGTATGQFSYSLDGSTFTDLGDVYALNTTWEFFEGYRFGIFNFATEALGGSVTVNSFTLS